jgi:hypothetical protein
MIHWVISFGNGSPHLVTLNNKPDIIVVKVICLR